MNIDNTDFLILKCLDDADQPLWKNRIYDRQSDLLDETVSVQTVGRRVDTLRDEGYLNSCIISPEDIKRDLIIAFKTTEEGEKALEEKRRSILMETVQQELFQNRDSDLSTAALNELLSDEFDLDDDAQELLEQDYSREELLTFLTLYYVHNQVQNIFSEDNLEKFSTLAEQNEELSNVLHNSIEETIIDAPS